jgi:hypothetical protein
LVDLILAGTPQFRQMGECGDGEFNLISRYAQYTKDVLQSSPDHEDLMPTVLPPSKRPTAEEQTARDVVQRFQVYAIGLILLVLAVMETPSDGALALSANEYAQMMLAP